MKNADMPAMPSGILQDFNNIEQEPLNQGLTKREHFAAMAMQGILSNDEAVCRLCAASDANNIGRTTLMATTAINVADALLAELEKTP